MTTKARHAYSISGFTILTRLIKNILILIISFLISRVMLVDSLMPFAVGLLAASFLNKSMCPPFCLIGCGLAFLLPLSDDIWFRLTGLFAVFVPLIIMKSKIAIKKWHSVVAVVFSGAVSIPIFKIDALYDVLVSAAEVMISIAAIFIFGSVINIFFSKSKRSLLGDEEVVCLGLTILLIVLGIGEVNVFGVYLRRIISTLFCLIVAHIGGGGIGAAAAIALAFANVLAGGESISYVGSMGAAGLIAGVLKSLRKTGVVLGFVLTNMLAVYIVEDYKSLLIPAIEIAIACIIFVSIPKKAYKKLGRYVDINIKRAFDRDLHLARFKDITSGKLLEISRVFKNTGELFISAANEKMKVKGNVSKVLGYLAEDVCGECKAFELCWEKEFLETYNVMNRMFISFEQKGYIESDDECTEFLKRCYHSDLLCETATELFKNYFINLKWKRKVEESKLVAGEQLSGVARVVRTLGERLSGGFEFLDEIEDAIYLRLDSLGLRPKEICAEDSGSGLTVVVKMRSCNGQKQCKSKVEKCVSIACGKKMQVADERCMGCGKDYCTTKYRQAKRFGIYTGLASAAKKGVCGDSHSFSGLDNGRYMMLICDGMGSGGKARKESQATAALLENFFHAEFDERTILSTINRLLILKSPEEMFSTVDMCVLDLIKGDVKFTKIGAPHSYIIRNKNASSVQAGALPIGILEEFKPMVQNRSIEDGDVIVMFSDGIADVEPKGDIGDWIRELIGTTKNPQSAAERILEGALNCEEQKDDMTVVVGRIVENK